MEKPKLTIEEINMNIIYIRFKGSYVEFRKNSRKFFNELFAYGKEHDLIEEGVSKVLTMYHDNPYITAAENLRTSVAITVPADTVIKEEGRIGNTSIEGKFAVLHYDLTLGEYEEAWKYAYSDEVLKNKQLVPRDAVPFELYVTEPPKNFKTKSETDIYIPIE